MENTKNNEWVNHYYKKLCESTNDQGLRKVIKKALESEYDDITIYEGSDFVFTIDWLKNAFKTDEEDNVLSALKWAEKANLLRMTYLGDDIYRIYANWEPLA